MAITLSAKSKDALVGVHPDLIRVVHRAAANATAAQDFKVIEGVRSKEQCCINYGKGRTAAQCLAKDVPARYAQPDAAKVTWLADPFKSNHAIKADGYGHAVDIAPYPIDWDDCARFVALSKVILAATKQEGVRIVWGGTWNTPDLPHWELP